MVNSVQAADTRTAADRGRAQPERTQLVEQEHPVELGCVDCELGVKRAGCCRFPPSAAANGV